MLNYIVLVVSLFALFGHSNCSPFKNCGGTVMGKVASVDVTNCPGAICPLKKGSSVNLTVTFQSLEKATKLTTVVHGIIGGIPVPFPVDNPESCTKHGLTCPLTSGKTYKYASVIPVKSAYPSMRLVVKWELRDESNKDVFCVEIPVQIVSADKKKEENSVLKFRSFRN